jgi:hypothetical protein
MEKKWGNQLKDFTKKKMKISLKESVIVYVNMKNSKRARLILGCVEELDRLLGRETTNISFLVA